ncbi:Cof-type HAD-IIB family hydrolase [Silvibacterium acidisoli]|uniref:Cof-type HAD-IIB family hydrolase n=1 Tax=Acidobacteriaceae bacterium ZG23-2 TaxID=2883246 RepID=UPI00406CBDF6
MTPAIRLIAIDIDGTLLPASGSVMSERTCRALREAQEAGIEIVIATGRRQAYAAPIIEPAELRSETVMITSNGTVTRTLGGERIDRFFLDVETCRELCPVLREFGGLTVFTFDREGRGELVLESAEKLSGRISLWVEANRAAIEEFQPLERAFDSGEEAVQGMLCGDIATMRQAEDALMTGGYADRIETHRTEYPLRELAILDILPPGCSKGAALRRLSESLGIQPEEVMAIGDNFNDVEMLLFAGNPVVMANGAPEVVQMAIDRGWQIAPNNSEDGVAQVLESVIESMRVPSMEGNAN